MDQKLDGLNCSYERADKKKYFCGCWELNTGYLDLNHLLYPVLPRFISNGTFRLLNI